MTFADRKQPGDLDHRGIFFLKRFQHLGEMEDIEKSIWNLEYAVQLTSHGYLTKAHRLSNLGYALLRRFKCCGKMEDINKSISSLEDAVQLTHSGHTDLLGFYNNLGNSYLRRFERTGDLQDIDCAISQHQKALESTPSGHADLPSLLNNLGSLYARRFERTGDLQDIDCAISHHQKALESTPSGHADLPRRFNNLGNSYSGRFEHTGDLQDIYCAISHHQKALESTPYGHADLPSRFNNLGNSYLGRFKRTGDLQDIDCAISHHQKAVESTPAGHADLPSRFTNLGNSYVGRFKRTGDLQDIDCAISHHLKAVESTPLITKTGIHRNPLNNHSVVMTLSRFTNLGNSYLRRFEQNHHNPDVQHSIASYRRGAEANGTPSIRLTSAKQAAKLSSLHDRSQGLIDFALAIRLHSEVAGLEQTIHRRHANLHGHSDLVGSAVATALHFSRPDLALEWLEQGRCLVWNQLNQLRTPIDDLRMKNPALADRFITAASALESYGTRSIFSSPSSHATLAEDIRLQDDTRNHTLHAAQYRQLLEEIRALPDFHNFLQPSKATDILSSLPPNGPVIIFNIHETRCDALALRAGIKDPLHIPLENFSLEQAEHLQKTLGFDLLKQREVEAQDRMPQRVRPYSSSMSFILNELWCKVVQPIIEALRYSLNPSGRCRVWWCPTGPLAFLPLHAAGVYGSAYNPGLCVFDFVVSSYTPTVQSLNKRSSAASASAKCTNLLLISPNTPGLPSIPFTQTEIHDIKALVNQFAIDALLLEDAVATADKVKGEMNAHSWVHFACHGIQDVDDPLKSGVHLHDGRLELLEIMQEKISNPELAFLSACQTSKGDLKLSEEVVHLAAGMLAAGYRGVVGTMWSISDLHGPQFAKEFYQYLLKEKGSEGLDSTQAAYALDYATRRVRETLTEDDAAFLTWVPYVHFGY
ncbi:hypothetical protein BYT27DRAFT_7155797 [Phlegmacium glaucopus]|nr:hypothetical protein BYT27DRAFT_7155797 [Phlegmacium glaucopus]